MATRKSSTRRPTQPQPVTPHPEPVIEPRDVFTATPVAGPSSRERAAELAESGAADAEATAAAAGARAAIVGKYDPAPLGGANATDVLGRELKGDADERRAQARAAVAERQRRVLEDTDRVNHGLEPKYATE